MGSVQAPALFSAVSDLASGVTGLATKIISTVEETTKDFEKEQQTFIQQKPAHEREDARGIEVFIVIFGY